MIQNRRKHFREGLAPEYATLYDVLCNLLDDKWQPYSGYRSFGEQHMLFDKHDGTTKADAGESAHNYGCATDWTIFDSNGHPIWLKKEDKLWDEYTTAIWKCGGLKAGADFGDVDHNELLIEGSWRNYRLGMNKNKENQK